MNVVKNVQCININECKMSCNDINKQQIVKKFEYLQIRQQDSQLLINSTRNFDSQNEN